MGVQLEPVSQRLEQYGPWHFRDIRFQQDQAQRIGLEAALLQTAAVSGLNERFCGTSKATKPDGHPRGAGRSLSAAKPLQPPTQCSRIVHASAPVSSRGPPARTSRSLFPETLHPSFAFTKIVPSDSQVVVDFPLRETLARPRPCLKRRRPDTDVDGPNSASLPSKKRRLLRHLVTSRLSQPFSLPASHILNRDAVATGDKRFVKIAAVMAARRLNSTSAVLPGQTASAPQQPSPSTWLRRAAMLNSLRRRVCTEAAERGRHAPVPDIAAKAAAFQQNHGPAAFLGGRYIVAAPASPHPGATMPPLHGGPPPPPSASFSCPPKPGNAAVPAASASAASAAASVPGLRPPGTQAPAPVVRIPSPKLRPLRSPELRVTRPLAPVEDLDALDDDYVAFPTADLESRYEDDPEEVEVYADFSVIFGSGGSGGGDGTGSGSGSGSGEDVEDYLDDLDGIPWNVRC